MAELGPVPTRPYILEPLRYAHHGLRFWDLWLGSRPVCPSPVPFVCFLLGRFLRDYDTLFPVADDVSLLQQASAVLYPSTATGTGPGPARWELGCEDPEEQREVYSQNTRVSQLSPEARQSPSPCFWRR